MAIGPIPAPARAFPVSRDAVSAQAVAVVALLVTGIVVWWVSVSSIHLEDMNDLGLFSVLPPGVWIGTALVTIGAAIAWRMGSEPLMVLAVLATILVLYGTGILGEPVMRLNTAWQHVGIADYIAEHQRIDPTIDAYFNWPGFFALSAFLSSTLGLDNIEPVARYAPFFYNVMYLLPLVAIGRSLFRDQRIVWLGIWLFYVCDWFGQDYYSPQGLAFFLYLVIIAVILRWLKGIPRASAAGPQRRWRALTQGLAAVPDSPTTPAQRALLVGLLGVVGAAIVASHQLTPFILVAGTAALAVVGWIRLRSLPVAFLLMALTWAAYMAITYLTGHIQALASDVGSLSGTLSAGSAGRVAGSTGHQTVVKIRLASMGLIWAIALLGFVRAGRRRELSFGLAALAAGPFFVVLLQSYGGEVLMRVALFSMPFMTMSAATVFVSRDRDRLGSPFALTALAVLATVLLVIWPITRYGNERMDSYSKADVAAVQALYRIAPEGSALFTPSWTLPWRYRQYADYYYYNSLTDGDPKPDLDAPNPDKMVRQLVLRMRQPRAPQTYLIITRSTSAQNDLFGPWKTGAQLRLQRVLLTSPQFRLVYRNPDATIFELR